eukprot:CAMPEP_0197662626 /NCGR_PEP_ID=MMETSP1338-20131121/54163_1 /TAXON_ID=43686 ORGANISM="Pelagodinium beii, Strain RCC1491" /NCGR_SAMPLE_ID=MMETSP1338 /ASSEMBLY_ACC=CAM_ASM_000754 /LENGTH=135 /DNA_ID=CAMNT_0043240555 /DNA_START=157 /DNA_END=565 /DNA_ORIENTATION=+
MSKNCWIQQPPALRPHDLTHLIAVLLAMRRLPPIVGLQLCRWAQAEVQSQQSQAGAGTVDEATALGTASAAAAVEAAALPFFGSASSSIAVAAASSAATGKPKTASVQALPCLSLAAAAGSSFEPLLQTARHLVP